MRLMRPLTMMATFFETAVATPIFCSMTSTEMSPSSPRRTSISSTWATMTGARPFGRLVHDQQMRISQQRARDRKHLLLAARELATAVVLSFGEARKGLVDTFDAPGPAPDAGGEPQMLVHAERAPQPAALRNIADAETRDPCRRLVGDVLAADPDRAATCPEQAHDAFAQRGLAHTVAADHREHAGLQRQVDALQRMRMPVIDVEPPDFERGCGAAGVTHDRLRGKAPALPDRIRFREAGLP